MKKGIDNSGVFDIIQLEKGKEIKTMKSIYDFVNLYNEIGFNCVVVEDKKEAYKEEEERKEA